MFNLHFTSGEIQVKVTSYKISVMLMSKQISILNTFDKKYRFFVNVSGKLLNTDLLKS
jgi:hypothetical protein